MHDAVYRSLCAVPGTRIGTVPGYGTWYRTVCIETTLLDGQARLDPPYLIRTGTRIHINRQTHSTAALSLTDVVYGYLIPEIRQRY
jgi:hypothetical protein